MNEEENSQPEPSVEEAIENHGEENISHPAPGVINLTEEQAIEKLKKVHIHFAMPCYGGTLTEGTFASFMNWTILAMRYGIAFSLDTMVNESLIPRGRNNLVAKFLANKQATHLMFVDSDIRFSPESVIRLILHDTTVACGLYPMKRLPIKYVLNIVKDARQVGSLYEVSTAGTGFMLIHRTVIEELIAKMPELKYKDSLGLGEIYEPHMYALFDTMIDQNGHYLSEDWTFCKRVREVIHRPIWVDTEIKLDHQGAYNFQGDVGQIKKLVEEWNAMNGASEEQNKAYEDAQIEIVEDVPGKS